MAEIRFHDRNTEARAGLSAAERCPDFYDEEKSRDWIPTVKLLVGGGDVLFDTCYRDCAVRNALQMTELAGG